MEKIESREKHLNNDLQNLIRQFKDVSIELSNTQAAIKDTEREREDIEKDLSDIIGENETVKSQMEQRGNTMADGSEYTHFSFVLCIHVYLASNFFRSCNKHQESNCQVEGGDWTYQLGNWITYACYRSGYHKTGIFVR